MREVLKIWKPFLPGDLVLGDDNLKRGCHVRNSKTKVEGVVLSARYDARGHASSIDVLWMIGIPVAPEYIELGVLGYPELEMLHFEVVDL